MEKKNVDWGKPISELPIVEWKDVADRTAAGELLIVLDGIVYKVWPSPGGMKETLKAASLKNGAGPELKLRGPSVLGRVQVDDFVRRHPGGEKVLRFWKGRDATRAFNGEIYNHSKAARNLLMHFRDARYATKTSPSLPPLDQTKCTDQTDMGLLSTFISARQSVINWSCPGTHLKSSEKERKGSSFHCRFSLYVHRLQEKLE